MRKPQNKHGPPAWPAQGILMRCLQGCKRLPRSNTLRKAVPKNFGISTPHLERECLFLQGTGSCAKKVFVIMAGVSQWEAENLSPHLLRQGSFCPVLMFPPDSGCKPTRYNSSWNSVVYKYLHTSQVVVYPLIAKFSWGIFMKMPKRNSDSFTSNYVMKNRW